MDKLSYQNVGVKGAPKRPMSTGYLQTLYMQATPHLGHAWEPTKLLRSLLFQLYVNPLPGMEAKSGPEDRVNY